MREPGWYHRLSWFFKQKFGEKVYKIPVHAGFTCPNRDGSISRNGCIYCYNPGFSPAADRADKRKELEDISLQISSFQAQKTKRKYLVYFQSYTNTYGETDHLRRLYQEALQFPHVVGISVATRPDCLSDRVLQLLSHLAKEYHVWVELGLQSTFDNTLKKINRGHTFACFKDAVKCLSDAGVWLCVHIINGLPGESREMMLESMERLNALPVHGIKFHQLQVVKHTPLEDMYYRGVVETMEQKDYLDIVCSQLEILKEDVVVHRLLSEVAQEDLLIAPRWKTGGGEFSQMVEAELRRRNSFQGDNHNF